MVQDASNMQQSETNRFFEYAKVKLCETWRFVLRELELSTNIDNLDGSSRQKDLSAAEYELELLANMVRLPLYLEKFMMLALLGCFDCFLYYFTVLPIRMIRNFMPNYKNRHRISRVYKERLIVFLIVVASLILSKLDTSKAYHRIKRQSAVKLYMLFGVLDMADKMFSSLGQSLLTILLSNRIKVRNLHRQFILSSLSVAYFVCHGYILVYETIALNVAVNSYSNSLLTLLLSIQFAELKGSVFKKVDKEGLFQVTIADTVERFKLMTLLLIITIRNLATRSVPSIVPNSWTLHATSSVVLGILCGPMFAAIGSEILVDWCKHAYITKFNRMRPHIYNRFFLVMFKDQNIGLHKFQDRLGLPLPTYVVLVLVMVLPTFPQFLKNSLMLWLPTILLLLFIILVTTKCILNYILRQWCTKLNQQISRIMELQSPQQVPGLISDGLGKMDELSRNIINMQGEKPKVQQNKELSLWDVEVLQRASGKDNSLEQVRRFEMVSKQIW